ncbi:asparagine synthase-related protein [Hydrogenibacillus schlegelii]
MGRHPGWLTGAGGRPRPLLREARAGIVPASSRARRKSPFPKTFHPRFAEGVRALAEARLRTPEAPLWTWIDRDAFARLIATFPNPEPFPWFGQLLDAPGWVAYLLAVDRWLDALRPSVRL